MREGGKGEWQDSIQCGEKLLPQNVQLPPKNYELTHTHFSVENFSGMLHNMHECMRRHLPAPQIEISRTSDGFHQVFISQRIACTLAKPGSKKLPISKSCR